MFRYKLFCRQIFLSLTVTKNKITKAFYNIFVAMMNIWPIQHLLTYYFEPKHFIHIIVKIYIKNILL